MMRWIVGSSLKFRLLVVTVAAGLLVLGFSRLDVSKDILPEFNQPTVEVQTEALGLSAEEVEQLITVPLEQDLLVGIAFLKDIESVSLPGLSSVVMTFEPGTELLDARQVVAERLTQAVAAAGLPQVAKPPQMIQPLSSTSRVAMVKLSSAELDPIDISILAKWIIAPRLLGVEGVANVSIWGFRDRQLQVLVDPRQLAEQGVTLNQVISTAGNALEVSPLSFLEASSPGTGGFIDTLNQRLHVFHQQAISTPEELEQVPLESPDGSLVPTDALTLGDVAQVVEDHQPLIGDALCSDGQCVLLVVEKFPDSNTPEVSAGVDEALSALSPGLPGLKFDTSVYRPAAFVQSSFENLGQALLIGAILVLLVLGAFFFGWRSALIGAFSILLSMAAAWLVLELSGTTVNTMILAGLVMALVVVIDDAVNGVDRVMRRIREHAEGDGAPVWKIVADATVELRRPILFATFIVAAALLPVFFMEGEAGAFLPSTAIAYLLAIVASFVVALTATPALGMMLLTKAPAEPKESPVARWVGSRYDRVARRAVGRMGPASALFGIVVIAGLICVPFMDLSLRPQLKERDLVVQLTAQPGTSLQRMDEITAQAVEGLGAVSGVNDIGAHVGRAVQSDQIVNVNSSEIWVNVDGAADYEATVAGIEGVARELPDVSSAVLTYSEQRVTDVLGRRGDEIVVRVYGDNPDVLSAKAEEVRQAVAGIDGVESPRVSLPADEPTIEVQADIARAEQYGISPGNIRRAATTLLSGLVVGNLFEEQKVFDVVVWGTPEIRQSEADVENLLIDTPRGGLVPLGEVADVRIVPNPAAIRHESAQPYVDVLVGVSGRGMGAVAEDIDRAIEQIQFPLEHHAEILGGFAEEAAARSRVVAIAAAALVGIFLLLQAAFTSWRLAILTFATLPMALAGAAVAVVVSGGDVTLGVVAGLVAALGVGARGSIVLIRHMQQLEREGEKFGIDLVIRGVRERLVPILCSAVAAVAVLLPLIIVGGSAGLEITGSMAAVIVGGVISSALLHVYVLPAAYLRFGFIEAPDTSADELYVVIPEVDTVGG